MFVVLSISVLNYRIYIYVFWLIKLHFFCCFQNVRRAFQDYCEAMSSLSLGIMELLGVSLGVGPSHFRDFFKGNDSIMRLNYYPPCQKPDLILGTGPHCDPTSLTILHQDDVGGLQVFVDGKWHSIPPCSEAFVVNIGDTFMVSPYGIVISIAYAFCVYRKGSFKSFVTFDDIVPTDLFLG